MERIGYVLIDSNGEQLKDFTDFPNPITLSSGDTVYGALVGDVLADGSKVVNLMRDDNSPGEWYDRVDITRVYNGEEVVLTVKYSDAPNLDAKRQTMIVSTFQANAALHNAGLLESVEALIADPATDPLVKLAWAKAQDFRRLSPMIASLAALLNLSEETLDELFEAAAAITA